jgi:hypothetical protein
MQIDRVVTETKLLQELNKSEQHVNSWSKRCFLLGKHQLQTSVLSPTIYSDDVVVSFSLSKVMMVGVTGKYLNASFGIIPH